jgi:hypothetical protein
VVDPVDPRTPITRDIAVSAAHFARARSMIAHLLRIALILEAATQTPPARCRRCAPTVPLEGRKVRRSVGQPDDNRFTQHA